MNSQPTIDERNETGDRNGGADDSSTLPMRPALRYTNPRPERLVFSRQLGVRDVIVHPYAQSYIAETDLPLPTDEVWTVEALVALRERIEDAGLRLGGVENLPLSLYDEVMLAGPRRDEQIEDVKQIVRNMGNAGIDLLGYNWMPDRVWRTTETARARGGAEATAFDAESETVREAGLTFEREYTETERWAAYERFLEEILPVAEDAGVTLALHPDDPPVDELGGVARLFRSVDALEQAMELVPSDAHAVELCLGTVSEMDGERSVLEAIQRFGAREEIAYVHFRDVEGTAPSFRETFVDEGNVDALDALGALRETGFDGMVIPDHVPRMEGEADWHPSGRAYTIGYLKGLLRTLTVNP